MFARLLGTIGSVVVSELRSAGYLKSTVGRYENTIKALAGFVAARGSVCFGPAASSFCAACRMAAGVPRRTIQEWMGHEDGDTTEVYMHYAPPDDEVQIVGRAFS